MTEDFKEQILNYLTGNISKQSPTNTLNYIGTDTITNNLKTYIENEISENFLLSNLIQSKTNDNILLIVKGSSSRRDYMVILDNNFIPITLISSFTSGVNFRNFLSFNVDENGYFYAIEADVSVITESGKTYYANKRFLLLNNITVANASGNYTVKIRKSYLIPNTTQLYYANIIPKIAKEAGKSIYAFLNKIVISASNSSWYMTKLTINVGIENEWEDKSLPQYYIIGSAGFDGYYAYINFDTNDNVVMNDVYIDTIDINLYSLSNNIENITTTPNIYINSSGLEGWFPAIVIKSNIYAYIFLLSEYTNSTRLTILLVNLQNKTFTEIYDYEDSSTYYWYGNYLKIYSYEAEVFFATILCNDITNKTYELKVGRVVDDKVYFNTIKDGIPDAEANISVFFVSKNYNLYRYFVRYLPNNIEVCKEIYNSNGYNGEYYTDINVLVPELATISSNNEVVYARTLYNKQINGGTTVSTIEIPNNYLNDISLQDKNLYSETNLLMNSDTTAFTKNIYETVDINFFNTLVMKNSNNPLNEIINNPGASRLNSSASQVLDYQNTYAGKIRINYVDNTNNVETVGIPTITNGIATYNFTIYVLKAISNIEIISNDENTSYQTINGTFNIGSTYTITQDVRVE